MHQLPQTASQTPKEYIVCNLAANNSTPPSPYPNKYPPQNSDPCTQSQPCVNFFQVLDMTPENPTNLCAEFASPLPTRKRIVKALEKFDFSVRKQTSENTSPLPAANTPNVKYLLRQNTEPIGVVSETTMTLFNDSSAAASDSKHKTGGRWSDYEHRRFLEGLKLYGKDWRLIEEHIGTRTCS